MRLRTSHTRADAIGELHDALWAIYQGELDLLIVKDAVDPAWMAEAVARAQAEPERFPWTPQEDPRRSHDEQMMVLGQTLTPVSGFDIDMAGYHAQAAALRRALGVLFGDAHGGFEATIAALLARLAGGREVFSPPSADGTGRYTPATVRKLPPGCQIPVHCGNFFLESPGYAHLRQTVAVLDQLSYFFPMQTPEAGGELLVYDLTWGDPATPRMAGIDMFDPKAIEAWDHERFAPEVGELLLFDGGRYFHKVSPVSGDRARWTIGGFVGFTQDHERVVYWS